MQTKKANRKRCVQCGKLVPVWTLAKSIDGRPLVAFHINGEGVGCVGSYRAAEGKADRDFRRAFTENKHGELA